MAERDVQSRLRRAVKDNNLFLVKRLVQRTDIRNLDPDHTRYTSLAWAAVSGSEETFDFLLSAGHDEEEISKDAEGNTILLLLADAKGTMVASPYRASCSDRDLPGASLRMAQRYLDRYREVLDWSNDDGKTALHVAALKGDEELCRLLLDMGADYDLADNEGNTPLHHASAWGHIAIVQLLIERGCTYVSKNNDGYTASDYAYSFSTKETLQDAARVYFEVQKRQRRNVFAQAAARGNEWSGGRESPPPVSVHSKQRSQQRELIPQSLRTRSGSGASGSTMTTDSGDPQPPLRHHPSYSSLSTGSSPSGSSTHPSVASLLSRQQTPQPPLASSNGSLHSSTVSQSSQPLPPNKASATLSPVASRMRERDADAMEKYMRARGRERSGSADTMSTDATRSQNGSTTTYSSTNGDVNFVSAGPSANGDDITGLANLNLTGSVASRRRILRPSASASQLGSGGQSVRPTHAPKDLGTPRSRSGTSPADLALQPNGAVSPAPTSAYTSSSAAQTPTPSSSALSPPPFTSPKKSASPRPSMTRADSAGYDDRGAFTGPSTAYASFPEPPPPPPPQPPVKPPSRSRLPFKLSKSGSSAADASTSGHRRGGSGPSAQQQAPTLTTIRGIL